MFSLETEGIWKKTEDFQYQMSHFLPDSWRASERLRSVVTGRKLLA